MSYLSPPYTDDDDARSTSSSSNSSTKGYETKLALKLRSVDPERAARLAARAARNRVSAQKSRDRKKKLVSEMEQESNQLRAEKAELEERVRTLEGLVKTLLMNQNLSPTTQMDPFSIAAPRENVLSPTDLLSKFTTKPCNQVSSHQQQSIYDSHACLPAEEVTFNRHDDNHERSNALQRAWILSWLTMSAKALTSLDTCQTDSVKEITMALQHTLKSAAASIQTKDHKLRIQRRAPIHQRLRNSARTCSKRRSALHHHHLRPIQCH
ncbi:uncharacterized protein FA14DRAFT_94769 [Meira miltonrushii]|uniref:BZIP domain-containing protein n=1 Tax=Meira miltonrushii TaxID=1280837 RepID=A0A316V5K5_9BASI|nr:uncharacterized protein FA14DRAFT_94769 [Meira miltonrushii]PWN31503.1 hypothetical protein FA14DRAFT_94769 [Meira miltonrushii]